MHNKRIEAMSWWNSLTDTEKEFYASSAFYLFGSPRLYTSLTGMEVEMIYDEKNRSDKEIIDIAFGE